MYIAILRSSTFIQFTFIKTFKMQSLADILPNAPSSAWLTAQVLSHTLGFHGNLSHTMAPPQHFCLFMQALPALPCLSEGRAWGIQNMNINSENSINSAVLNTAFLSLQSLRHCCQPSSGVGEHHELRSQPTMRIHRLVHQSMWKLNLPALFNPGLSLHVVSAGSMSHFPSAVQMQAKG